MAHRAYQARLLSLDSLPDLQREMMALGADKGGITIMAAKGVIRLIRVEQIPTQAANIIKQEILARGGDLATPWSAAAFAEPRVDVIFIGTVNTLRSTISKLYRQRVFDLPAIADAVQQVLIRTTPGYLPVARQPSRQGVVVEETMDDLAGGRLPVDPHSHRATGLPTLMPLGESEWQLGRHTYIMAPLWPEAVLQDDGASAAEAARAGTDVLAVEADASGASPSTAAEAIRVLRQRCPAVPVAVRTGTAAAAEAALEAGAAILHIQVGTEPLHVQGGKSDAGDRPTADGSSGDAGLGTPTEVLRAAIGASALMVLPHAPAKPVEGDLLTAMAGHFHQAIEAALAMGFREEQLILDVGLAQGKSPEQDGEVLQRLRELTSFGRPLLVDLACAAAHWAESRAGCGAAVPPTGGQAECAAAAALAVVRGADFLVIPNQPELMAAVRTADWLTRRIDRHS